MDYQYAGTTEDGDVWSSKITPDDGKVVHKAVVYRGQTVVIHETPRYRLYLISRKKRFASEPTDPPDWPLP